MRCDIYSDVWDIFLIGLPDLWVFLLFQVQELITEASKNANGGSEPVMPLIRIRVRNLRTPLCLVNSVFGT